MSENTPGRSLFVVDWPRSYAAGEWEEMTAGERKTWDEMAADFARRDLYAALLEDRERDLSLLRAENKALAADAAAASKTRDRLGSEALAARERDSYQRQLLSEVLDMWGSTSSHTASGVTKLHPYSNCPETYGCDECRLIWKIAASIAPQRHVGDCQRCGAPVHARAGKPGEYDHDCDEYLNENGGAIQARDD